MKTYAITFTVIQFRASVGFRFYTVCGGENYNCYNPTPCHWNARSAEAFGLTDWHTFSSAGVWRLKHMMNISDLPDDHWLVNLHVNQIISTTFRLGVIIDNYDAFIVICDHSQNDKSYSWLQESVYFWTHTFSYYIDNYSSVSENVVL